MRFRTGLTVRGWVLLVVGAAAAAGAAAIGEPDLAWVGLFLGGIPLLGLFIVLLLSPRLVVERRVDPPSVAIGEPARARLTLINSRALALADLTFRDHTPEHLGPDAAFELARGIGSWSQGVVYEVPTVMRGHFPLGPLTARSVDPFATAYRRWSVPGEPAWLRVTPRIWELPLPRAGKSSGATGEATPQKVGQAGADDVLVREYQHGDGLRRVHWKMSAKRGELMVRLEEQPWDPAMTILVDTRQLAHMGSGPNSSLEWGISFGASLANKLVGERQRVSVLGADGTIFKPLRGEGPTSTDRLIAAMTDIRPSGHASLEACLADPDALSTAQAVVAALGVLTALDAAALVAAAARLAEADALVPDAAAFGLPPDRAAAHDEACRLLRANGWNLVTYTPSTAVTEGWHELLARRDAS